MPTLINETGLRFAVITGRVPPSPLTATLIVKGAFSIQPDSTAVLLPEELQPQMDGDVAWDGDAARGLRSPSDFAWFKPGADLLLAGHCHAPGGKPVPFTQVSFGVANFRKSAVVFGDRLLKRNLISTGLSEPVPFTVMPLDWSRAYGGPEFPNNPVGRGINEVVLADGSKSRLAPNIESTKNLVSGSGAHVDPTGFGPVDPNWPLRSKKVGTYNGRWQAERWPWLPDDFDWTFFNAAPRDQYLDQIFLEGNEPLEFLNLHPVHSVLRTTLPGLRARCFLRERRGRVLEFREVPMRIDTLFADLDNQHIVLTWRGVTPAVSLKLKEFEEYFVILEPRDRPLGNSLQDYENLYLKRQKEIKSEFEVPPVILEPPVMPTITPPSIAWGDRLTKLADEIRASAKVTSPMPPPATGLGGVPLPVAALPATAPVQQSISEAIAAMNADWARVDADNPGFSAKYPPPDFSDLEKDMAELAAYTGLPPVAEDEAEVEWSREKVVERAAAGGDFKGQDLSGLDLSGLVLKGMCFAESSLEEADLTGTNLERADLTRATLTSAKLNGATLDDAILVEADLSSISARESSFVRANLQEADFTGATLDKSRFMEARGARCSFAGCELSEGNFQAADLEAADFSGAILESANFKGAILTRADLDGVEAPRATFEGAKAQNLRASKANLTGACFRSCTMDEAVMEESILTEADMREVILRMATLTGSTINRAMFAIADLRQAKLDDVIGVDANFIGVNLFRGTLERADLAGAKFLDCNLYEVEFFETLLSSTRFEDTNLKGTKLAV
jgi:uncharacterized protein YjbI with pentapeptide repeats